MEHLKDLIDKLEVATEKQVQIQILQKIGGLLITDYVIQVKDQILEPLWVEAYYYDPEKFPDCNTHMSSKQQKRLGQLYFHEKGRGGMDICLSNGEYYLSFLIKASYLYTVGKESEKQFCKQTDVYELLKRTGYEEKDVEARTDVLVSRETGHTVRYAKRINMAKPCYQDVPLAAFALDEIAGNPFDGFRSSLRDPAVAYMKEYMASHPNGTRKEYEAECYRVFDWMPVAIYDLLRNLP